MNPTKNDLPADKRTAVIKLLNERLADLIDLGLQAKQAHWNVKGLNFIAVHKLFDEIAEEIEEYIDNTAERAVALGGIAEGTVGAVGKKTKLPPYPTTITGWREHVEAFSSALAAAGKLVRAAIAQADELGDDDTADLFTQTSRDLDKNLWFVESHLQGEK
jgi:starvation-inducible DNA-binding protein